MAESELTLKDLAELIKATKNDLSEQINNVQRQIEDKLSTEINNIKTDVVCISSRLDSVEDRFEKMDRQLHLTDLLIYGMPLDSRENLRSICYDISNIIGFNDIDYALLSAFRTNYNTAKPPIVLKFISLPAKNEFLHLYIQAAKKKPLILRDIGFEEMDRINIQESLSSLNASFFRKAMELKRNDFIYSVYTNNGLVRIKITANSNAIKITSLQQLQEIQTKGVKISKKKT